MLIYHSLALKLLLLLFLKQSPISISLPARLMLKTATKRMSKGRRLQAMTAAKGKGSEIFV